MNVTQLVFAWPREAQYSCEPDTYQGWAIEDYDFELSGVAPAAGNVRSWEGRQWTVAQVEDYSLADGLENSFSSRAPTTGDRCLETAIAPPSSKPLPSGGVVLGNVTPLTAIVRFCPPGLYASAFLGVTGRHGATPSVKWRKGHLALPRAQIARPTPK